MYITDSQNSPLKNISDIGGNLAYKGNVISSSQSNILPTDIPGLVRWYSSENGVLNQSGNPCQHGEQVYTWKNLASSTTGDIASPNYHNPIYLTGIYKTNFPVLDFGSTGLMTGIHNNYIEGCIDKYTIILNRKRKFETGAANCYEFVQGGDGYPIRIILMAPYLDDHTYFDAGNASSQRISTPNHQCNETGDWQIIKGIRRKSSSQLIVNNTIIASTISNSWTGSANTTGFFFLGGYYNAPTVYAVNSYFSEFLMYNRDLLAGELSLLDRYLLKY